ncbi:hypothetical protein ACEWY4_003598 [Coilia grayii]|uniref:Small integral membrane protein 5 n=1 Tax=Coilia grayii TaxID=363190 RepID=A0ABD1KRS3_9TELE
MEVKEEVLDILQRVWAKLQGLPEANSLEIGAFFILILFVATFLMLIVLSCIHCCWDRLKTRRAEFPSKLLELRSASMNMESVPKPPVQDASPLDWAEWGWQRLQSQPWALGGAVVIAVLFVVFVAMIIFAMSYGCCCSSGSTRQYKKNRNGVL